MADTPEDLPPIGTAQNAADVARKAELEAHEADISRRLQAHNEANALRTGIVRHAVSEGALLWTDKQIADAYRHMEKFASGPNGHNTEADFRDALKLLVSETMSD